MELYYKHLMQKSRTSLLKPLWNVWHRLFFHRKSQLNNLTDNPASNYISFCPIINRTKCYWLILQGSYQVKFTCGLKVELFTISNDVTLNCGFFKSKKSLKTGVCNALCKTENTSLAATALSFWMLHLSVDNFTGSTRKVS